MIVPLYHLTRVDAIYYWNTLTDVIGRTSLDVVYDETIDSATVGASIQQEVEDAIAAGA